LNREFKAEKPNEKWLTDVTEMKYGASQKAYLSAILELYDGSIGCIDNGPMEAFWGTLKCEKYYLNKYS
jgi:transposase InsO family protein